MKMSRVKEQAAEPEALPVNYRGLVENSRDIFLQVGPDVDVVYASPSAIRVLGWDPSELLGKNFVLHVHEEDVGELVQASLDLHHGAKVADQRIFRFFKKNGEMIWLEGLAKAMGDRPADEEFMVVVRDVTRQKTLEEKLRRMAEVDGLTGLPNRRELDRALAEEWGSALSRRHSAEPTELSLLFLDLDHFKSLNDTFGHLTGDDCLRSVAGVIRSLVAEETYFFARYGGEEFVVLMPHTGQAAAVALAERIRMQIEALQIPSGKTSDLGSIITASCGVATVDFHHLPSGASTAELLGAADRQLYRSKGKGRNRVEAVVLT